MKNKKREDQEIRKKTLREGKRETDKGKRKRRNNERIGGGVIPMETSVMMTDYHDKKKEKKNWVKEKKASDKQKYRKRKVN